MIEAVGLTKRYGATVAVNDLSFTAQSGKVTGFLGPNGAGKSTTMRMILGLDRPSAGQTRVAGRPYEQLKEPLRTVGALLDARAVHPNRSARAHLRWLAKSNNLPAGRVDEVLGMVGLHDVADKRAGGFSLGGEQSGHVVLPGHATTGDGLLTALRVMGRMAATGGTLTSLGTTMHRLPQVLENVRVVDKSVAVSAPTVAQAVADAEAELGEQGRVLLRPSGTEQLVRVMVEAPSEEIADVTARRIAEVVAAIR